MRASMPASAPRRRRRTAAGSANAKCEKAPCSSVTDAHRRRAARQAGQRVRHQPGAEAVPDEVHPHAPAASCRATGRAPPARPCPPGSSSASRWPAGAPPWRRASSRAEPSPMPAGPVAAVTRRRGRLRWPAAPSRYRSNSSVGSSPSIRGAPGGVRSGACRPRRRRDRSRRAPAEKSVRQPWNSVERRGVAAREQLRHPVSGAVASGNSSRSPASVSVSSRGRRAPRRAPRRRRRRPPTRAAAGRRRRRKSGIGSSDHRWDGQTTPTSPSDRGRSGRAGRRAAEEPSYSPGAPAVVVPAVREDDQVGDARGRPRPGTRGRGPSGSPSASNVTPRTAARRWAIISSSEQLSSDRLQGPHQVEQAGPWKSAAAERVADP